MRVIQLCIGLARATLAIYGQFRIERYAHDEDVVNQSPNTESIQPIAQTAENRDDEEPIDDHSIDNYGVDLLAIAKKEAQARWRGADVKLRSRFAKHIDEAIWKNLSPASTNWI
jgi:hypothetical protein